MNFFERLKKGTIWSLMARIIGGLVGFVLVALLARLLSVEALAEYYLFQVVVRTGALFVRAGMDISLQKVLGIATEKSDWFLIEKYNRSALRIIVITSILCAIILHIVWTPLALGPLSSKELATVGGVVIIAVVLRACEELGSAYFRGVHEAKIGVLLLDIPRQVLLVSFLIFTFFYVGNASFLEVINYYLLSSLGSVFLITFFYMGWNKKHKASVCNKQMRVEEASVGALLSLSIPMMLQAGAALLLSTADIWVLGMYASKEDVAIYGTVIKLTMLLKLMLSVINMVIPPVLASLYQSRNLEGLENMLRTAATWSWFIVVPILSILFMKGEWVLDLLFGERFRLGYPLLVILASAGAVNALSGSPGMLLQMAGYHRQLMILTIVWGVLNLLANIFGVKLFGVVGVAAATGLSVIGQNLSTIYLVKKKIGVRTWARVPGKNLINGGWK